MGTSQSGWPVRRSGERNRLYSSNVVWQFYIIIIRPGQDFAQTFHTQPPALVKSTTYLPPFNIENISNGACAYLSNQLMGERFKIVQNNIIVFLSHSLMHKYTHIHNNHIFSLIHKYTYKHTLIYKNTYTRARVYMLIRIRRALNFLWRLSLSSDRELPSL